MKLSTTFNLQDNVKNAKTEKIFLINCTEVTHYFEN